MKTIIDGKLYSTETAEQIHVWGSLGLTGNCCLYRTPKGNYFGVRMYVYPWPEFTPLSTTLDVVRWLEENNGEGALLEHFPDWVEEA